MKLRYFDIERFGTWNNARLDGLQNGLTVIYGPNGSGKTTLMQFVRAVFYGRPQQGSHRYLPAVHPGSQGGRVGVTQENREFIVNRFWENNTSSDDATITTADGTVHDSVAIRQLLGEVGEDVFTELFTVGYREAEHFDMIVREALADGESTQVSSDEANRVRRAISDLDSASDRLAELHAEQNRLQKQISDLNAQRITPPAELVKVRENIARLESLIRELQSRIATLEDEIARCEAVENRVANDGINSSGERVRQLEKQIANWRNWQREIDEQLAAVRNQLHHAALRDCDPVDRTPEAQMLRTRGTMTVIENQLDDIQSRLTQVRMDNLSDTPGSIQTDLNDLRDHVFGLCHQLGHHEVLDEIVSLEAESLQLQRCRTEIDRQLSIMIGRRRILMHQYSNGAPDSFRGHSHHEQATCHSHAHDQWLTTPAKPAPVVNHNLEAMIAERDGLLEQLRVAQHELAEYGRRRIELERLLHDSDIAHQLESLRFDLNVVEEEIRLQQEEKDVRTTTRTLLQEMQVDYESRRRSVVLQEASEFLQRLHGEHCELVENSDSRTIDVIDARGGTKPLTALSRGERDQVGLSLRLALTRAHARRGTRLPLILDDVFITSDSESAEATAVLLRDFAADNQQILFFTCHEHIAQMFRRLGVTVRDLPQQNAQIVVQEQRQPQPIVPKVVAEPRPPMRPVVTTVAPVAPVVQTPLDTSLVVKAFKSEHEEIKDVPVQHGVEFQPTANWIFYTELSTPVDELSSITMEQVEELESCGVQTVDHLLALVPDNATLQLSNLSLSPEQIRMWQSQAMLSCRIPMLRRADAELLVLCNISTPQQLADMHPDEVFELVSRYLRTNDGSRFIRKSSPFDHQTAINWVRWSAHARTLWHSRERNERSANRTTSSFRHSGNGNGNRNGDETRIRSEETSAARRSRDSRTSSSASRKTSSRRRSSTRSDHSSNTNTATATGESSSSTTTKTKTVRFFLERDAPVEDAPSIGPKTASLLEEIGIITVRDLLRADAEAAAVELDHKRINARMIAEWQAQSILVCCIPELRGHDAQILVGCEVTTPEEVAAHRPADLFAKVAPFVETSEGQRIVRSGKKPDLAEVTFWIECAGQSRALKAA